MFLNIILIYQADPCIEIEWEYYIAMLTIQNSLWSKPEIIYKPACYKHAIFESVLHAVQLKFNLTKSIKNF